MRAIIAKAEPATRLLTAATPHDLGLMALRSMMIAGKFGLTLFIARYVGLADLGFYGLITSAAVLAPVLLGFGVSNNLGRDAARDGPASVCTRLLQYFLFLLPIYGGACLLGIVLFPAKALWVGALLVLMFLEHIQTDMFALMAITGRAYAANIINFVRSAGWVLAYVPLALAQPGLRNIGAVCLAWLAGCALATLLTLALTTDWRWGAAARRLPGSRFTLPHRHGSGALYLNDVANTLFQYLDRYVVGAFLSPTVLGVYVLFWSIANAMNNLITTAVVQTRKGELVQVAHLPTALFNRELHKLTAVTTRMACAMSVAAIVLMYVVTPYIGRPEINPYLALMFLLCGALIVRTAYEVLGIAFYAHRRDDITLYSGSAILAVALLLNLALDPTLGIWGAGIALLGSYTIGVLTRYLVIYRGFRTRAPALATAGDR